MREGNVLTGELLRSGRLRPSEHDYTLTFTGDLGRKNLPILRDPAPVPAAHFLISESTYGNRKHPPAENLEDDLGRSLGSGRRAHDNEVCSTFTEALRHLSSRR